MMEWITYLHGCRSREIDIIFKRCPQRLFGSVLELGAGDGFQSRLLSRYSERLISTDVNPGFLERQGRAEGGIEYRLCDAQRAGDIFGKGCFDAVFSSNLLEHVKDPAGALYSVHEVLKDDGITIHVMPSPFWKVCVLLFRVPYLYMVFLERLLGRGAVFRVAGKTFSLKKCSYLIPRPHGSAKNPFWELYTFSQYRWKRQFEKAGFDLITVGRGPVVSGYGFGLSRLRVALERAGMSSEYIYVAVKRGRQSPYQKYFSAMPYKKIFTDNPRIAMYIWRFPPVIGGAEKQCRILSEELARKEVPVFVVTERVKNTNKSEVINNVRVYRVSSLDWLRRLPSYVKQRFYSAKDKEKGYGRFSDAQNRHKIIKPISRFLTYGVPNRYFFLMSLWIFYKKRNEFDIIHVHEAHWIAAFGVRIAKLLNKKIVVKETISGNRMTFKRQPIGLQREVKQADFFIAISNEISSDLVSAGINGKRIRKIPNGVRVNSGARRQFNDSEKRTVVCLSKINQLPNKGIDILLKAWAMTIQRYPKEADLHILGGGDPFLFKALARALNIAPYVHFAGFVRDVEDYLLRSYLFVLPSRAEGLSNALLEAMSAGLPCVATDISGNKDVIRPGINGLLVPADNSDAMAEAILFLLNNPAEAAQMGRNAREMIEKEYTISIIADRYVKMYKETIGGSA